MTAKELAGHIAQLAIEKKGKEVILMNLEGLSDIADYFVIISGESDIHLKTLANFIEDKLKEEKISVWRKEGFEHMNWVLLDFVEVVVHLFRPEKREYFNLERLWADAKITEVHDETASPASGKILSKSNE